MATLDNKVNPLDWQVPIVDTRGAPTVEFQRKWNQQARTNASIPDLTTAAKVSGVLDLIAATPGSLLARGASVWAGLAPSAAGKILKDNGAGNAPSWATLSSVVDLIGNTRGSVLYRGATGWSVLAPSAAGKVLTDGGVGADPSWQTASGSGGGAASAQDNGATLYFALSDADGQLVLDGAGDPVFVPEVLPPAALPVATTAAFGAMKPDGVTIVATAGVLSTDVPYLQVSLASNITLAHSTATKINFDTVNHDSKGWWSAVNHNYVPQKAGRYLVNVNLNIAGVYAANALYAAYVFLNAAAAYFAAQSAYGNAASASMGISVCGVIVQCNGTTDAISCQGYSEATTPTVSGSAPPSCSMSILYLGP